MPTAAVVRSLNSNGSQVSTSMMHSNPNTDQSNANANIVSVDATPDGAAVDRTEQSTNGNALPSINSAQQLMPPSDGESHAYGANGVGGAMRNRLLRINRNHFTAAILCFINLINYMDRYTIPGVIVPIQEQFNIGDDGGGLLQTVFVISYMICAPLFGYLGDRYSRRWIMALGIFIWSGTTLLGSYTTDFISFLSFRALVGIGEASYSTIAPTIISDLYVHDMRSKMLAVFYFAIPVGSGLGYIIGSKTAALMGNWRYALRVTPALGAIAVILIYFIKDPERGESEGSHNLRTTTYMKDIQELLRNRSFMLSTGGFTCVAFVAGALAWWAPKIIYLGLQLHEGNANLTLNDISYKIGIITMFAGITGVPLGSFLSQRWRPTVANCDPYICSIGLLVSAPLVYLALVMTKSNTVVCFMLIFAAQMSLNLCWSIVADILMYVVVPTRRSTAEAFQILISHLFGDAGSPYLVGVISEAVKKYLRKLKTTSYEFVNDNTPSLSLTLDNADNINLSNVTSLLTPTLSSPSDFKKVTEFQALQSALFSTTFVEVLGGIFFLVTATYIVADKRRASEDAHGSVQNYPPVDIDNIS